MGDNFDAGEFYSMFRNAAINHEAEAEWAEYRCRTTDFILKNAGEGGSLAVYGAGRCNDIDLHRLSCYFSEITLLDRDNEAQKSAIMKITGTEKDGSAAAITAENVDFVGIRDSYYIGFINYFHDNIRYLKNSHDYERFTEEILEYITDAYSSVEDYRFQTEKKNDYSVMLGLHSQLNNSFSGIWNYVLASVASIKGKDDRMYMEFIGILSEIEKLQSMENEKIVKRVNDSVLSATKKGVFLGYEICLSDMRNSLIEGAYQSSMDFEKREKDGLLKNLDFSRLVWPLDAKRGTVYDVMLGFWETADKNKSAAP